MAERVKIVCPKCDYVIASAPEGGLTDANLICSNCGAEVRSPSPLEKAAEKARILLVETEKKLEDKVRSR